LGQRARPLVLFGFAPRRGFEPLGFGRRRCQRAELRQPPPQPGPLGQPVGHVQLDQDEESFRSSTASFEQLDSESIKRFVVAVSFESAVEELESTEASSTGNISLAAGFGDLILGEAMFGTMLGGCN
jgi:hypothetical protein